MSKSTVKVKGEFGYESTKELLKFLVQEGFSVEMEVIGKVTIIDAEKDNE